MTNSTNCHSSNIQSNFCVKRSAFLIIVESCIFIYISFFSLQGNFFVCVAIYRRPSRRTVTNQFILSLAVTDLLISLLILLPLSYSSILDTVGRDSKGRYLRWFFLSCEDRVSSYSTKQEWRVGTVHFKNFCGTFN